MFYGCIPPEVAPICDLRSTSLKKSGDIVYHNLNTYLLLLKQCRFRVRAIISDNHTTNVKAYNRLLTNYKSQDKDYKITNPYISHENIYLLFDTSLLIKNIRILW